MKEAETMNEAEILFAPVIDLPEPRTIPWPEDLPFPPRDKWEREYQAFLRLRPALLKTHRGKFVAIHEGKVVESGDDLHHVADHAYARHGYVPMYIDQVTEERRVERIPTRRGARAEELA